MEKSCRIPFSASIDWTTSISRLRVSVSRSSCVYFLPKSAVWDHVWISVEAPPSGTAAGLSKRQSLQSLFLFLTMPRLRFLQSSDNKLQCRAHFLRVEFYLAQIELCKLGCDFSDKIGLPLLLLCRFKLFFRHFLSFALLDGFQPFIIFLFNVRSLMHGF